MPQETCRNGFGEAEKGAGEIRLTKARKEQTCEREKATEGLFLASQCHKYYSVGFIGWGFTRPTQVPGTGLDHSSDSLVTDWHLKPALTPVQTAQRCTVTSLYVCDRPPLRCQSGFLWGGFRNF